MTATRKPSKIPTTSYGREQLQEYDRAFHIGYHDWYAYAYEFPERLASRPITTRQGYMDGVAVAHEALKRRDAMLARIRAEWDRS